jgi:hypothetical protein
MFVRAVNRIVWTNYAEWFDLIVECGKVKSRSDVMVLWVIRFAFFRGTNMQDAIVVVSRRVPLVTLVLRCQLVGSDHQVSNSQASLTTSPVCISLRRSHLIGVPLPIVNCTRRGRQGLSMHETLQFLSPSMSPSSRRQPLEQTMVVNWRFVVSLTLQCMSHPGVVPPTCFRHCALTPVMLLH